MPSIRAQVAELLAAATELSARANPAELEAALAALNDVRIDFSRRPPDPQPGPRAARLPRWPTPYTRETDPCGRSALDLTHDQAR